MKKKVLLLVSILLIVILSISVLTACKDKSKKVSDTQIEESNNSTQQEDKKDDNPVTPVDPVDPIGPVDPVDPQINPGDWINAFIDTGVSMVNWYKKYYSDEHVTKIDGLENFSILTEINGESFNDYCYLEYCDTESGKYSLYNMLSGKMIIDNEDAELIDISPLNTLCLAIRTESEDGNEIYTLYDNFGNEVFSIEIDSTFLNMVFSIDSVVVDTDGNYCLRLTIEIIYRDSTETEEYFFREIDYLYKIYEYMEGYSFGIEEYVPQKVGEQLISTNERVPFTIQIDYMSSLMTYELSNYKGYTFDGYVNYSGDYVETFYDADGNVVSTIVIPTNIMNAYSNQEFIYTSETSGIYILLKQTSLYADYDYMYYDLNTKSDIYFDRECYYVDLLTGTFEKIDLDYHVIDVLYDFEVVIDYSKIFGTFPTVHTNEGILHTTVVKVAEIIDGKASLDTKYLVLNADGSIKADITDIVKTSMLSDQIAKINDDRYLVFVEGMTDDKYVVLDGQLNVVFEVNMETYSGHCYNNCIYGYIDYAGTNYYGAIDLDGNIIIPFEYDLIYPLESYDGYSHMAIASDSDGNYYMISINEDKIEKIKIGLSEIAGEKEYTDFDSISYYDIFYTWKTKVVEVLGADENDKKYVIEITLKFVNNDTSIVWYYGSYDTKAEAENDIVNDIVNIDVVGYNLNNNKLDITFVIFSNYAQYDSDSGMWGTANMVDYYKMNTSLIVSRLF